MFRSLAGYEKRWVRGDLVAGLTVWAVLVPEALAYASIAGVSPVVGLYAAPGALILYAALGSSRELVTGPMSATAALSAATVGDLVGTHAHGFAAFTAALAVATGVAALLAGLLRLGFLASLISEPVIKGFIVGLALTIVAGQLPKLTGVEGAGGDFFEKVWHVVSRLGDAQTTTMIVAACSLILVLGLRRVVPAVPGSLVAVLLSILAVQLLHLERHGVAIVGHIDAGLPAFGTPDVALGDYGRLAAGAVGVMLVGFAEGLGAAKTYAAREHYDVDANRELLGLGAANLASGLSSGMVVNGSLSKTAVNGSAGAKTQLSGLVVAILTVFTLLVLTGLFEKLPEATLAAVVIAAVIELVDVRALTGYYRVYSEAPPRLRAIAARPDFAAAAAAMLGVMVFDTLPGLFIGIAVSLVLLLYRASQPHVAVLGRVPGAAGQYADLARHPDNRAVPGVVVLRVESGLFFANADWVRREIRRQAAHEGVRAVVLDAETVPFVDVTASGALAQTADELDSGGVELVLARDIGQVRDVLGARGSRVRVFADVESAVAAVGGAITRPG